MQLSLWDTTGQEDYERLRPLSYIKAHIVLISFSVGSVQGHKEVRCKWAEEVKGLVELSVLPAVIVKM